MRWLLPLLLASIATLVVSHTAAPASPPDAWHPAALPLRQPAPPRLFCEHPRHLYLRRFEDRSARLECAGRVIARVSVPG